MPITTTLFIVSDPVIDYYLKYRINIIPSYFRYDTNLHWCLWWSQVRRQESTMTSPTVKLRLSNNQRYYSKLGIIQDESLSRRGSCSSETLCSRRGSQNSFTESEQIRRNSYSCDVDWESGSSSDVRTISPIPPDSVSIGGESSSSGVNFSIDSDDGDGTHEAKGNWRNRKRAQSTPLRRIQAGEGMMLETSFGIGFPLDDETFLEEKSMPQSLRIRSNSLADEGYTDESLSGSFCCLKARAMPLDTEQKRDAYSQPVLTNYMRCDEHTSSSGRMALFCEQCSIPMCFKCRSAYHTGHKYTTIDSAATKRKASVKRVKNTLQFKYENFQNLKQKLSHYEDELDVKYDFVVQQINDRANNLHNLVDQWHSKTMMQLDSIWKQERALLSSRVNEIEATLAEIDDAFEHVESLLYYNCANDFLTLSGEVDARLQDLQYREISGLDARLCAIFTSSVDLTPDMFGKLSIERLEDDNVALHHITRGRELLSFDSRPKNAASRYTASGLSLTPSGDIIVTDIGMDTAQLFTACGTPLLTFNTLPEDHPTTAIMISHGRVVIACRTGLKLFDTDGEFRKKLRDAECPNGLALTYNGDLVVSDMVPDGCVLQIYANSSLKLIHTIIGGYRAPCFERPWYLAVDSENDILVADYHEHCVKIFSAFGGLLHEFGGKGCKPGQFFHPAGLCIDRHGHILVADSFNDRIQLFTKAGEFLGVILNGMEDILLNPIDVAINNEGHLVVLQGDGQVRTFQYIW